MTTGPYRAVKGKRNALDVVFLLVLTALVAAYAFLSMHNTSSVSDPAAALYLKGGKKSASASPTTAVLATGTLEITEIMASNKGSITAENGNYYDWIELFNPTGGAIDLAGYGLSDNVKKPMKFVLPDYALGPGKYVIVFASKLASTSTEIHADFGLRSSGRTVLLSDPVGNEIQSVTYPALQKDTSYSMDSSDPGKWTVTDHYTPGFPNTEEGYAEYQQTRHATAPVGIDEVMAGNTMTIKDEDGDYSDWVELYNPTNETVDLTGWGLSNKEGEPKRWVFPQTQIGPGQRIVVFASGKNRSEAGKELHTNFHLNGFQDTVLLSNLRGQIVSEVAINNLKKDASYGLTPGAGKWQVFTHPTPGYPNTEAGWNTLQPKLYAGIDGAPVVINAVMSNNATTLKDQEGNYPGWIELYNRSGKSINLKGYGLTSKSSAIGFWQFPDVTLNPGAYLTVFATGPNTISPGSNTNALYADFKISASKGAVVALSAPDGSVLDRCFVPPLRPDVAYGRVQGSTAFSYITNITLGAPIKSGYPDISPDPVYSVKAGMYDKAQQVSLSTSDPNAGIYYTLDGSVPTNKSTRYTGPLEIQKSTAVRAISCHDGYLPSDGVCSTYLINEGIKLPVLSITTDPKLLYDPTTGLFEMGPNASSTFPYAGANFWNKTEIPVYVELIDPDGTMEFSQDAGLRLFGQYSRGEKFKGISLTARSKYGNHSFADTLFPDLSYTSYKSFTARPSGQDVNRSRIRDELITSLVQETTDLDIRDSRDVVEFINGEFQGVTQIREKLGTQYLAQHYKLDPTKIDYLDGNGKVKAGSNKDYMALISYVKTHDLSVQANYDYVASQMDIASYIDWYTCEICSGNSDMGNIRFWRSEAPGSKWKWIFFDFCWGFNTLNRSDIKLDLNPAGNGVNHAFSTALINGLLRNSAFKQKFLERLAYHITVTFEPKRVLDRINEIVTQIQPYMDRDFMKWGYGTEATWQRQVDVLRKYAEQHPALLKQQMKDYFNLSDAQMQKLFPQ